MENRVAMISIVVEDYSAAESVNALLHQFGQYIIGRMGIPYRARKISLILRLTVPASSPVIFFSTCWVMVEPPNVS